MVQMLVKQYGVQLRRITASDLEMVRRWRNAPHNRARYLYDGHIESAEQVAWFQRINTAANHYFIMEDGGEQLGMVDTRIIDAVSGLAEGGIMAGDHAAALEHRMGLFLTVMMNYCVHVLELQACLAKIRPENTQAIACNQQLGFRLLEHCGAYDLYRVEGSVARRRSLQLDRLFQQYGPRQNPSSIEVCLDVREDPEDVLQLFDALRQRHLKKARVQIIFL